MDYTHSGFQTLCTGEFCSVPFDILNADTIHLIAKKNMKTRLFFNLTSKKKTQHNKIHKCQSPCITLNLCETL